jgi:hypothetical protein
MTQLKLYSTLFAASAFTPVVWGQGTVELVFPNYGYECQVESMELTAQGVLRVQCVDTGTGDSGSDGGDVTTAENPTPVIAEDPSPVTDAGGDAGDGSYLGQLADGTWVTEAEERSGEISDRLYIPNRDDYHTMVYTAAGKETMIPGCIDETWLSAACRTDGSLAGDVTYARRLRSREDIQGAYVRFTSGETGDQLLNYDYSFSTDPGDLDPANPNCKEKGGPAARFDFTSWACDTPLQDLDDGQFKTYYANVRAAGNNADRCGNGINCRMYNRGW